MAEFRKKPVVVDAVQFDFAADVWPDGVERPADNEKGIGYGYINTLEGRMIVSGGDWVITGIKGERYPCKPDIFKATYEAVEKVNSTDPVDDGNAVSGYEYVTEVEKVNSTDPVDDGALPALRSALKKLTDQKSGERTSKDRYIAIAITDLEKLIAFVAMYC